jgi:lysophospholipase L1-like esterase
MIPHQECFWCFEMAKLLVHGDSNVVANYVSGGNWPQVVANGLGFTSLVNLAVPGYYVEGVQAQIGSMIAAAPQHAIVMVGCNNMAGAVSGNLSHASTLANYLTRQTAIIDGLQAAGIPVTIVSPAFTFATRPVTIDAITYVGASAGARETARWPAWVAGLKALCLDRGCGFVDIWTAMAAFSETATTAAFEALYQVPSLDGYHLSAAGHSFVAARVIQQYQEAHAVTVTPDLNVSDMVEVNNLADMLLLANPVPGAGRKLIVRITDNGTARALTYGTQYRGVLPTATQLNKALYLGFIWNSPRASWDLAGVTAV